MRDQDSIIASLKVQRHFLQKQKKQIKENKIICTGEHDIRGAISALDWVLNMVQNEGDLKYFRFPLGHVIASDLID